MQRLWLLGFMVLSSFIIQAQKPCDLTISGSVVDEHDASKLAFATIMIEGTNLQTISDSNGRYRLEHVCPGTYTVQCLHVGCEPVLDTLIVRGNISHDFILEHHLELLQQIEITAMAKRRQDEHVALVKQKTLERTKSQPLANSLETVSGVSSLKTGGSIAKPVIRGLHSNRILILNQGVRQEGQQWGNEHGPEIDPNVAGELKVIKGASGIRYGSDALGGVILVDAKPLPDSVRIGGSFDAQGESNAQVFGSALMLEGRSKLVPAIQWRLQGSGKKGGNQKAPDYFLKNTGFEEANFSTQFKFSNERQGAEVFYSQFNTRLGIFSASHIGNLTDLQRAIEASQPVETAGFSYAIEAPYQNVHHELIKGSAHSRIGSSLDLSVMYARQYNLRQEYDRHSSANDDPALQFEITTHSAEVTLASETLKSHDWVIGVAGMQQDNTYEGRLFIPNFSKWQAGAFATDKWHVGSSHWMVESGIRFDAVEQIAYLWSGQTAEEDRRDYQNVAGNLGVSIPFASHWKLYSGLARAWRAPNSAELYSNGLHHGAATFEIGDSTMREEVAYSATAIMSYERKKWHVDIEPYVSIIEDFIYLKPQQPATLTIRGAFPTFAYAQVDAILYGTDLSAIWMLSDRTTVQFQGSILRAQNQSTGEWLSQMPADQAKLQLSTSPFRLSKGYSFDLSIEEHWVNKQWRIPSNQDYAPSPRGAFLTNLHATLELKRKSIYQLRTGIYNLFNQRYRNYLNRYRYFSDETGFNYYLQLSINF